eukprot:TCALIF_04797-PA protein Name:"Similar to ost-1 SPARC (Caenorhabditis elegans)" AED:0.18 eAED:0.18 QI:0/0.71/0.75/0.87/0.85/1/8/109/286
MAPIEMKALVVMLLATGLLLTADAVKKHRRVQGGGFSWDHRRSAGMWNDSPQDGQDEIPDVIQANDVDALEDGDDNTDEMPGVYRIEEPCREMECGAGRECWFNEESEEGECRCIVECGRENDPRRQVCSNHNVTYPTECDLFRALCLCEEGSEECEDPEKLADAHIEYYGACRDIPKCASEELADFPRRMREWLFNEDLSKRWENAAVWKWCDLDGEPADKSVSRHELFPVKAPLQSLEHCIGDFLEGCDVDGDHQITLKEWGACLNLEASNLEARCETLNKSDE